MLLSLERRILVAFCVTGLVWALTKQEHGWKSTWLEPGVQYAEPFSVTR
ncbi:MAG: hypothetical protein RL173_250 [Fibrobacterota bacterium]|jgi:hypothetical protein